jgi:sulfate adenylyltransferase large subunit
MAEQDTLRISTAGSVDDGKSTLIGRLLHEAHGILDDQLAQLSLATQRHGHVPATEAIDFSLLTDGLIAEREQGITIDVAYRYFTTEKRRYILADTPGHVQYTRNMVTGASTADVAIILVDASRGLTAQSHRHAVIAAMLGIPEIIVAVNKMDLVGYAESRFIELKQSFNAFLQRLDALCGARSVTFIPMSALTGEMLVSRGSQLNWYQGSTLLGKLESALPRRLADSALRFPVQRVARAKFGKNADLRGYQGTVAAGTVAVGDSVSVLPSVDDIEGIDSMRAVVAAIHCVTMTGTTAELVNKPRAERGEAITLVLDRQIALSRGDMLVRTAPTIDKNSKPIIGRSFSADLCWFAAPVLEFNRRYWIKHTTRQTRAVIEKIVFKRNVETLAEETASVIGMNDIARVVLQTQSPLVVDSYVQEHETGAFILIDDVTHQTVAAGMIMAVVNVVNDENKDT